MPESNIDWSLLPQPRLFFSLPEEFELEALKKAYKSYIKIYKPDLFPDEFKKIRHAYEILLENLNKNRFEKYLENVEKQESKEVDPLDSNALFPTNLSADSSVRSNPVNHVPLYDQPDLPSIREALRNMPMSARTCMYWAALSDVEKGEFDHFYWLIKGLQFIDINDYYYYSFLNKFILSCNAEDHWVDVLEEHSSSIKANVFYQFLYPIINQMVKDLKTERVVQCIHLCEKKLTFLGDYIGQKQEVYLMLLGKSILTRKPEVYMPIVDFLQSYKSRLSDEQYATFEFYLDLIVAINEKHKLKSDHEIFIKFDDLVETYISHDEEKCRKIIYDIKSYFKKEMKFEKFFVEEEFNSYCFAKYKILKYIFEDLGHLLDYKEYENKEVVDRVDSFNRLCQTKFREAMFFYFYLPIIQIFVSNVVLQAILFFIASLLVSIIYDFEFIICMGVFGAILAGLYLMKKKMVNYLDAFAIKIDNKIYLKKVQKSVFELIFKREMLLAHISLLPQIYTEENKIVQGKKVYAYLLNEKFYFIHELFAKLK